MWHGRNACHAVALSEGGSVCKSGHRCPEVCLRRVPELDDERMVFERVLDDPALDAFAASVNQSHFAQAGFVCRRDVLDHHRCHVARREGMEIERVFDWNVFQDGYVAVTTVFIPPRTAKSPTTVMRLG